MRQPFIRSFACAFQGIFHTFREGRNFKVQACFGVLAVCLGFAFGIEPTEWLAIIVCIGGVLGGECMNTALEAVVDLVSPDYHELARIAKDCAAGAVLVFALASLAVGLVIFAPRIVALALGAIYA